MNALGTNDSQNNNLTISVNNEIQQPCSGQTDTHTHCSFTHVCMAWTTRHSVNHHTLSQYTTFTTHAHNIATIHSHIPVQTHARTHIQSATRWLSEWSTVERRNSNEFRENERRTDGS
jgi:hypothetical protein